MWLQDVRFGLRMMLKTPVVTIVAVLSLALGIAANASMFSVVNAFLFEPLPYEDQDEMVLLRTVAPDEDIELAGGVSYPNARDLFESAESLESWAAYSIERANLTGLDIPEQISVVVSNTTVFDVFGVQPAMGRGFRPEEAADGRVLVLEYDYWQRRFFGDREVLGRSVTMDGDPYTIVGVMPESFDMIPANVHAFRPSDFAGSEDTRASRALMAFGRLAPGNTLDSFQREVDRRTTSLQAEYPDANRGMTFVVQDLRSFFPGPTDTALLKILMAVTLFGLLIACANIANLLLGRAEERQREVAVRTALGAGRGRILRQMLTESIVLAVSAGGIGTVLSIWIVRWLKTVMPSQLPAALMPELDPEVLIATLAVSIVAGLVFGATPAFQAVRGRLSESLGGGARGGTAGRQRKRLRSAFVIGEVAVALALLSGSGFLIQAFDQLANADPGFESEGVLTFQLALLDDRYPTDEDRVVYQRDLLSALSGIPGVEAVAAMSSLPRGRSNPQTRYTVDGRPVPEPTDQPLSGLQSVNPAYFETLEVEVIAGRALLDSDREDAMAVAVVSDAFVQREFPETDPLGRQITVNGTSRTIVGVTESIVQDRMALRGRAGEMIYLPLDQAPLRNPSFALRADGDPSRLAADVREAVWSVEADQPIAELQTLDAFIAESLAGPRAISSFLMAMGAIALILAAMGIYGVMAHAVTQQRREIGIRMALGAQRGSVVGMMARSGLSLVFLGVLLGSPLAWLMFRGTLSGLGIFEAELGFGIPLGLASTLVVVAILATIVPARRASGVAPASALTE